MNMQVCRCLCYASETKRSHHFFNSGQIKLSPFYMGMLDLMFLSEEHITSNEL